MSKIIRVNKNRMSKATLLGEPSVPGYIQLASNMLKRTANLADLTDVAEARQNLGVASIDDLSVAATPNSIVKRDENARFKIMDAEATNEPVSLNQLNNMQYDLTSNNITGILPLAKGGTGASTAANARANLGLGTLSTKNSITWNEVTGKPSLAPMPNSGIWVGIATTNFRFELPIGGTWAYSVLNINQELRGEVGYVGIAFGGTSINTSLSSNWGFAWRIQ